MKPAIMAEQQNKKIIGRYNLTDTAWSNNCIYKKNGNLMMTATLCWFRNKNFITEIKLAMLMRSKDTT